MVKKRPDGPSSDSVTPHLRQSSNVRVSLAAIADGMGEMVWIAAGHSADTMLESDAIADPSQTDGCPGDGVTNECARGGFGRTGGQFYKPEEGL
ncbi:MAG: hypothetical protein K2X00_22510 [Nitrospiraceae bacterium]|nr:hypothetical protein [Nitrospiraceae bacterium]OQW64337.1 MAG: hypothetical protein BVN29_13670 [Nitrospira sp. ST-bin5]